MLLKRNTQTMIMDVATIICAKIDIVSMVVVIDFSQIKGNEN